MISTGQKHGKCQNGLRNLEPPFLETSVEVAGNAAAALRGARRDKPGPEK
jgi:hypothetical protein